MIISEYSEFYSMSFGYLHLEIQSLEREVKKTQWSNLQHLYSILAMDMHAFSQFIIVKSGTGWFSLIVVKMVVSVDV